MFEPLEQCIRNWMKQAERDESKRQDGLTALEKEELGLLRRENRMLREEREHGAAWFARDTGKIAPEISLLARVPGQRTPETRTTWWSEWSSNFRYSLWGESEANRDRQTWQQR